MAGGHDDGIGFAGKVLIFGLGALAIVFAGRFALEAYRDDCVRFGNCKVVVDTSPQQRPTFQGVAPATTQPSWPQPTQTTRQDGRDTVKTTTTAVPKMTEQVCRTHYGGTWEPSPSGGPNVCRVKK